MPARAPFPNDGETFHVIRRGHNRTACFLRDEDRALYLALLVRFARETGTLVHAYVLMPNHVHLLVTTAAAEGVSRLMYRVGQHYSKSFNRTHVRTGTVWEESLRAYPVRSDAYVLACHRYIELNPVRAGIAQAPADFQWSSYASNAGLDAESWLTPHPSYQALAGVPDRLHASYRALFDVELDPLVVADLRTRGEPPGSPIDPRSGGQAAANWSSARRA